MSVYAKMDHYILAFTYGEVEDMDKSSIVVITGANSGMGKATSIELAKTGAHIVMLCRNKERGEEALREVQALSGSNCNMDN